MPTRTTRTTRQTNRVVRHQTGERLASNTVPASDRRDAHETLLFETHQEIQEAAADGLARAFSNVPPRLRGLARAATAWCVWSCATA